jgi:transcriptional antiterminator RfaH
MEWFVAHTKPHAEARAARQLENQGFAVYVPRYLKSRRHARRQEIVSAPLFPRYLFVGMDLLRARWRAVRSTIGVVSLVCHGDAPTPVPPRVLDAIRARENESGHVVIERPSFARGDRVAIEQGAFSGLTGLFLSMADDQRIVLLLDLLGRQVRVQLPPDAVALAR